MPELPEVETVKRGLKQHIVGRTIKSVDFDWPKSFPNSEYDVQSFLLGAKVLDVRRRAKVLIIDLNSDYSLICHLKMTGQLVFVGQKRFGAGHPSGSLVGKLPDKSTRVKFEFNDQTHLFFNDQRKFGWIKLVPTAQIQNVDFIKKLGPEPLEADFTVQVFADRLKRRSASPIKAVILDQTVLAGVGNIYADESLWAAQIHPATKTGKLTKAQIVKLHSEIVAVLNLSINHGGSTDKNYVDAEGNKGSYLKFAKVFRLNGSPCKRCGNVVTKIRVAGRGTHICTVCQKT